MRKFPIEKKRERRQSGRVPTLNIYSLFGGGRKELMRYVIRDVRKEMIDRRVGRGDGSARVKLEGEF